MKKIFIITALTLVLAAGCGKSLTEKAAENAIGGDANVDINGNGVKVETKDGTAQWGANKMPENWPSDAPVYPGATVQFSGSQNPTGGQVGVSVMLQTADSGAKVLEYYKKEFASQGWKIEGAYQTGENATIGAKKDNRTAVISVVTGGGQTSITQVISQE